MIKDFFRKRLLASNVKTVENLFIVHLRFQEISGAVKEDSR